MDTEIVSDFVYVLAGLPIWNLYRDHPLASGGRVPSLNFSYTLRHQSTQAPVQCSTGTKPVSSSNASAGPTESTLTPASTLSTGQSQPHQSDWSWPLVALGSPHTLVGNQRDNISKHFLTFHTLECFLMVYSRPFFTSATWSTKRIVWEAIVGFW